jgi:predicted ATP-dependent endonuclease of OLD family
MIDRIKLHNFKKFENADISFNDGLNLFIGDNEAGKSSLLSAIDIVISGSRYKIESIGLESIFNAKIIQDFLNSDKSIENLPKLFIEIYLNEQNNPNTNGRFNSSDTECDGLLLECCYDEILSNEIEEILSADNPCFPFEYYISSFKTFSGESYTGYKKFLKHLLIDNTRISNEYAVNDYIKTAYTTIVDGVKQNKYEYQYRQHKSKFEQNVLQELNNGLDYEFKVRTNTKSNLSTDLTISEQDINIENQGKGRQCLIKTEVALKKGNNNQELDIVLIEEPENHLSHINIKKIISKISEANNQVFIATHNSLISTRLDLRNAIFLNSGSQNAAKLNDLSEETAKFFMKAPDNNILEFVLSEKVILVEGYAEFILMDAFFRNATKDELSNSDIHIISVGGISFKRYLELAKLLDIKTAVIRDNDKNHQENCINNYDSYVGDNIKIFFEKEDEKYTFEVSIYSSNKAVCDTLFNNNTQEYMLKNKSKVAFELLDKKADEIITPNYIKEAIQWIK